MWNNYLSTPKPHASESYKNSSRAETITAIAIIAVIATAWMIL